MRETSETIRAWADETFGPTTRTRAMLRALEEAVELAIAIDDDAPPERIAEEAADVAICLCRSDDRLRLDPRVPGRGSLIVTSRLILREIVRFSLGAPMASLSYLHDICAMVGASLPEAIDAKMVINRARAWRKDGRGCGYHAREGDI